MGSLLCRRLWLVSICHKAAFEIEEDTLLVLLWPCMRIDPMVVVRESQAVGTPTMPHTPRDAALRVQPNWSAEAPA